MIKKEFGGNKGEKRIAILEGEEIDVTKIPLGVQLELAELAGNKEISDSEKLERLMSAISLACKSNPKITIEWLKENTDFETLIDFMNFALEPLKKRAENSKKPDTPQNQTQE